MKDGNKTKKQLANELLELRQQIFELETLKQQYKQLGMKLSESEDRYKALFDHSLFCVYIHDFEGRFIDANEAALNLLGYIKEEITSLDFSSLLEKEHLPAAFTIMEEIKETGFQKKPAEWKLRKKNGEYVWVETEASIIYRTGKPYALQGIARDITDKKRAEKALRESEEKFRILAETNTAAIVIFQGEKFCYVNPATEVLTGCSKEELLKKNFGDFIHPEFRQLIKEREFMRQQGEKVDPISEFKIITKSGEPRWVTTTGGIIEFNGKPATIGAAFDITERKQVEEALSQSEERFRSFLNNIDDIAYTIDTQGVVTYANPIAEKVTGMPLKDIIGKTFLHYFTEESQKLAAEVYQRTLSGESPEYELTFNNGKIFYFKNKPLRDIEGKIVGVFGIARDITEHKRSEEALRESEEKFRILAEINAAAIVIFQGYKLRYINPATETLTGYTKEEILKINYWDIVHPEFRELVKERWFARLRGEKVDQIVEFKITTKSGKMRWLSVSDGIIELEGKPVGIGTAFDVTERKQVEEALQESEKKYRDLVDNALVGIFKTKLKGDILYVNEALWRMLEFESCEEMMAESALKRYKNPKDRELLIVNLKKKNKVNNFDIELLTKTGKTKNVLLSANLDGDIVSGMIMDITERKQVEEELLESEKRFRAIFESASDGILIVDVETKKIYLGNRMIRKMLGCSEGEITNLTVMDIHPEEDLPYVLTQFEKLAREEIPLAENIPVKRKDGRVFYVDISTFWLTLADKTYMTGIFRDITERKTTAEVLRESEERYRTIFEDSRDAIYITTRDGIFVDVNQSTLNLFGYTREEMIGMNALQIYVNSDDRSTFQQEIEQMGSVRDYEVQFRKKDGTEMDCLLTSTIWRSLDGNILGYQGIIRDVTERKQAENQLKYISLHDSLTGLYNRAYFEEEMRRLESRRFSPVGLLTCDIDGLKLINDALGHDKGDNLLLATANVLRESFREGDMVARVGGDEFAVLLPNSDRDALERATQRIRHAVTKYNKNISEFPLSISIGSAIAIDAFKNMGDLFKEADNNMYREKLQHSQSARSNIVQTLMKTMEARDFITEGHAVRLKDMVAAVAKAIGLPERCVNDLRLLAQFHDIGKVGIPDRILFKPGPFTPEEHTEMQWHCEIGHRIALSAPDLSPIVDLILKHHEWWNGQGYPLGLKGDEIPVECRILAIADAYDAMTSDRPYRKAESHEKAVNELRRCAGTQFDPELVSKFIEVMEERNTD